MQQLGDKIPQLHAQALDRYNAEGARLQNQLSVLMQQEGTDYDRYRDSVADEDAAFNRITAEWLLSNGWIQQSDMPADLISDEDLAETEDPVEALVAEILESGEGAEDPASADEIHQRWKKSLCEDILLRRVIG